MQSLKDRIASKSLGAKEWAGLCEELHERFNSQRTRTFIRRQIKIKLEESKPFTVKTAKLLKTKLFQHALKEKQQKQKVSTPAPEVSEMTLFRFTREYADAPVVFNSAYPTGPTPSTTRTPVTRIIGPSEGFCPQCKAVLPYHMPGCGLEGRSDFLPLPLNHPTSAAAAVEERDRRSDFELRQCWSKAQGDEALLRMKQQELTAQRAAERAYLVEHCLVCSALTKIGDPLDPNHNCSLFQEE